MGRTLEALHSLQVVELQLTRLRQERETKARRVQIHQRRVRKAEEKLQGSQALIRERQKQLDALQLEIAVREEVVDKHRQGLNRAKTNKEYAAILTAMNTEKADNSKLESDVIKLMDEIHALTDGTTGIEAERTKVLEDVARTEEELRAYEEMSREQQDELQSKRDECAERIEPTTLVSFNRVAKHHDGEAMAPVQKLHPKRDEYVCSGCHMKVALEVVNALQTRDEIQICRVCGRIHFLEEPATQRSGT